MSVQTDPYTFTNGTVADALEVNARISLLYTLQNGGIDAANVDLTDDYAWTGAHTFDEITSATITTATITDGAVYGQRLMFTRTFILPEYVQDEVDFVPILPVESLAFPYGILITKFGIKTDANTTYSVVLEDWSDPQTHSADISTVATSASDEAASAALTTTVAAGNIVGVDLPTTTGVNSLQVWFEYEIKAS